MTQLFGNMWLARLIGLSARRYGAAYFFHRWWICLRWPGQGNRADLSSFMHIYRM